MSIQLYFYSPEKMSLEDSVLPGFKIYNFIFNLHTEGTERFIKARNKTTRFPEAIPAGGFFSNWNYN